MMSVSRKYFLEKRKVKFGVKTAAPRVEQNVPLKIWEVSGSSEYIYTCASSK